VSEGAGKAPPGPAPPDRAPSDRAPSERPPASFTLLVASLAAQVQVSLGLVENPVTGKTERDLAAAKHGIDLLEVIEAKTKGNLDEREAGLLAHLLYDLRMAYVGTIRGPS
jgi:hypothetical protein